MIYILVRFFFQAEDGIRDLVRSRGLGDVYKRQEFDSLSDVISFGVAPAVLAYHWGLKPVADEIGVPVSYTHLTLPTSDLV